MVDCEMNFLSTISISSFFNLFLENMAIGDYLDMKGPKGEEMR